jgi:hypothetical protein
VQRCSGARDGEEQASALRTISKPTHERDCDEDHD